MEQSNYKRPYSWRKKISIALKGKPKSQEARCKMSIAQKGKKQSQEHIAKRVAKKTGQKRSKETREKQSISARLVDHSWVRRPLGERAWNWRGGVTKETEKIRHSPEYKYWRTHVFNRDNFTCQGCGVRGGYLEADHELPFSLYPELRFEILNGRTMCRPCHQKTDSWGGRVLLRFMNKT